MRARASGQPLALELVEEGAEGIGEVEGRGRAGEGGVGGDQAADEAGELELAAEGGHRRRQRGGEAGVVGEFGDDADARQQARGGAGEGGGEGGGEGALGPAGVDPDLDAGHGLGRLAGEAGVEAGDERAGEVGARGEREDAGAGVRREQRHRASSASARAMPSGRPTSTQPPVWTTPNRRPWAISRSQTGLREKAGPSKPARAAGSMIPAPA